MKNMPLAATVLAMMISTSAVGLWSNRPRPAPVVSPTSAGVSAVEETARQEQIDKAYQDGFKSYGREAYRELRGIVKSCNRKTLDHLHDSDYDSMDVQADVCYQCSRSFSSIRDENSWMSRRRVRRSYDEEGELRDAFERGRDAASEKLVCDLEAGIEKVEVECLGDHCEPLVAYLNKAVTAAKTID
ncbi:hypothetical protein KY362_04455 [Candidatus Woesearchaeota archaeon]|nr:hypothetical protein [Candidatus Woesearchaeota archaeon]